jgi:putative DNA primase/helicase
MDNAGKDTAAVLDLEPDAADLFDLWREDVDADAEDKGSLYRGMVGKLPGVVLRLALVIELLGWADGTAAEPRTVSVASVRHAIAYAEDYQKPMALRVFGDAALPLVERNAATLGRYIIKHGLTLVNLTCPR